MKKVFVLLMVMVLAMSATAFADDTVATRGLRRGLELEGAELEAFHEEMLAEKQVWIDALVEAGDITAEEGQAFINRMQEGFENCDGEAKEYGKQLSIGSGKGFGAMSGQRRGNGRGMANGSQGGWSTRE